MQPIFGKIVLLSAAISHPLSPLTPCLDVLSTPFIAWQHAFDVPQQVVPLVSDFSPPSSSRHLQSRHELRVTGSYPQLAECLILHDELLEFKRVCHRRSSRATARPFLG